MHSESTVARDTLTVVEAAQRLGISRAAAYQGARSGAIPVIRIGGRLLVPRAALDRLLERGAAAGQPS